MNIKILSETIARLVKEKFNVSIEVELTRPEEKFGDYATNVALQLAGELQKNPRELAEVIVQELRVKAGEYVREITIAGPWFYKSDTS